MLSIVGTKIPKLNDSNLTETVNKFGIMKTAHNIETVVTKKTSLMKIGILGVTLLK